MHVHGLCISKCDVFFTLLNHQQPIALRSTHQKTSLNSFHRSNDSHCSYTFQQIAPFLQVAYQTCTSTVAHRGISVAADKAPSDSTNGCLPFSFVPLPSITCNLQDLPLPHQYRSPTHGYHHSECWRCTSLFQLGLGISVDYRYKCHQSLVRSFLLRKRSSRCAQCHSTLQNMVNVSSATYFLPSPESRLVW